MQDSHRTLRCRGEDTKAHTKIGNRRLPSPWRSPGLYSGSTTLPCSSGLLGRPRPFGGRPLGRGGAAQPAALAGRGAIFFRPASGAALLSTVRLLVYGRPGSSLGFLLRNAAMFVALLDMFGLTLLLVGIAGLVSARHGGLHRLNPKA